MGTEQLHVAIDARVINDRFPGIGRYVASLAEALGELPGGPRLTLVVNRGQADSRFGFGGGGGEGGGFGGCAGGGEGGGAGGGAAGLTVAAGGIRSLVSQFTVPRAIAKAGADVFHATYWLTAYRVPVPVVLSLYDVIGWTKASGLSLASRLALKVAVYLALKSASQVVTLSEHSRRQIVEVVGLDPAIVRVTPLGAASSFRPQPSHAVEAARQALGLPNRYVAYVGSNKPHKNLETLVGAWAEVGPRHPDTTLVLGGSWDKRYPAESLGDVVPPEAGIMFVGPIPEELLPAVYSGAAAFAFPSVSEGFGLPVLEAMACGTPVVVADPSSLPEVVAGAGLMAAPRDRRDWAAALERVLSDSDVAADLSARGRARAAAFTWRRTAETTIDAYRAAARLAAP